MKREKIRCTGNTPDSDLTWISFSRIYGAALSELRFLSRTCKPNRSLDTALQPDRAPRGCEGKDKKERVVA